MTEQEQSYSAGEIYEAARQEHSVSGVAEELPSHKQRDRFAGLCFGLQQVQQRSDAQEGQEGGFDVTLERAFAHATYQVENTGYGIKSRGNQPEFQCFHGVQM